MFFSFLCPSVSFSLLGWQSLLVGAPRLQDQAKDQAPARQLAVFFSSYWKIGESFSSPVVRKFFG